MEGALSRVNEGFPLPVNEKDSRTQIDEALKELESHFSGKQYWASKNHLSLGQNRVPVVFLFTINSQASGPQAVSSIPSAFPMPMAISAITGPSGNICWTLEVVFPDSKKDTYIGGSSGGCLEHLSKRGGLYYSTIGLNGRDLEKYYLNMSISIPQAESDRGKWFLFGTDSQQWSKDAITFDWNPVTQEEVLEIQALRGGNPSPNTSSAPDS